MTKSPFTCTVCGELLHPREVGVACVGFTADGPLYQHSGACQETAEQRRLDTLECRECRKSFPRQADPKRPGRTAEYCGKACRKAHARNVARLWRQAAKGDMPATIADCEQRRHAVTALWNDVRAHRFNGVTPDVARDTLLAYHHRLESHERELVKAQKLDEQRRRAEAMRDWVQAQQAETENAMSTFLGGLDAAED